MKQVIKKAFTTVQSKVRKLAEYKPDKSTKIIGLVVIALLIFELGLNIGNGRIGLFYSSQNSNLPNQLNYSTVNQVYNELRNQYDGKLTTTQLLNGLNSGLANATGDPYTEYFNSTQAKAFNEELSGSFSGIGAELGVNSSNVIEVIAPLAGTPAAKAGLQPKDVIVAINGKSTSSMTVDTAVNDIRGPSGSKVTLSVVRNGSQQLTFTIIRANITVPSVNYKILNGNIGYMQITQFSNDTSGLAQQAAQNFNQNHVNGIILDLRDNPGGLVNAAVNVSSLWLPAGKVIMEEKTGNTVVQTYRSTGNDLLNTVPTVILINAGSASASEITTGALHDNGAAHVIGVKSYGKGVVQQLDNLSGGAELKVTVASWYRPNGQDINHVGITPDQTVQITAAQAAANQDPQQAAAVAWLEQH
jgi:carboxyl-terminal processing protease